MPSLETIEKTYVEAITSTFPLQRLIIFVCGIIFSLAIKNHNYKSVSETISKLKLSEFTSLSSDLFKETELMDVFFGFLLLGITWFIANKVMNLIFNLAARGSKIWSRIEKNSIDFSQLDISKRKEAIEWIDSITSNKKSKISAINSFSELFLGLSIALVISSYWGNILDLLCSILFFSLFLILKIKSINLFISDVLGFISVRNQIQGISIKADNSPN